MQILTSSTLGHFFVRPSRVLVCRASKQPENNERNNYNVRKGKQFENARRRRGRPAHLRSPYDSPLRDGNRDRLIGLLTERAAKTLMVYLMETNANVYSWLVEFYKSNPIPKNGSWDEVSGEAFLRKLLSMPIEEAKFNTGRDSLFDNVRSCGVDPRSIAQRIMDIRTQLSEEFIQELQAIAEENSVLLRETLQTSLSTSLPTLDDPAAAGKDGPVHPELAEPTVSSSSTAQGSNGSSQGGAATTPPPSPAPDAPKSKPEPTKASSSSSSSAKKDSDAADKAAAVAALNAALKAAPAAGSGAGSSKRPDAAAAGSSDEKVDMADVLAQLRRAMEADVARDVMKMKENTTSSPAAAGSGVQDSASGDSAAAAGAVTGPDTAAPAEGAEASRLDPTATPQEDDGSAPDVTVAAAADGIPDGAGADSSSDEDSTGSVSTQLSSSAVGEAGTYSRMLPKGWGPRLGVGFSNYPRSRNNIVSSASLGVSVSSPVPTTGDAAGAASSSTEAV